MCANVSEWILKCTSKVTLMSSYLNQLAADVPSNEIGYLVEYKLCTHVTCPNELDFKICNAHQNQHSGGYVSGMLKFLEVPNQSLTEILKKNDSIQVSFVSISLILFSFKPCN